MSSELETLRQENEALKADIEDLEDMLKQYERLAAERGVKVTMLTRDIGRVVNMYNLLFAEYKKVIGYLGKVAEVGGLPVEKPKEEPKEPKKRRFNIVWGDEDGKGT